MHHILADVQCVIISDTQCSCKKNSIYWYTKNNRSKLKTKTINEQQHIYSVLHIHVPSPLYSYIQHFWIVQNGMKFVVTTYMYTTYTCIVDVLDIYMYTAAALNSTNAECWEFVLGMNKCDLIYFVYKSPEC